jgi:hypothetical protein
MKLDQANVIKHKLLSLEKILLNDADTVIFTS